MNRILATTVAAALVLAASGSSRRLLAGPVDSVFQPNLYIYNIYPAEDYVTVKVCNGGSAAPASSLRMEHFFSPWRWSNQDVQPDVPVPAIAANSCVYVQVSTYSDIEESHEYFVWVDTFDDVAESNESDNDEHYIF